MNNKLEKLQKSFIGATLTLMSGTIVAQLLSVCISPIMTRLFSSDEIGKYTLILTAISMFGTILSLRYDMSIVPEDDEKNVYALIKLSFIICFILSFFISIGYSMYCVFHGSLNMSFIEIALWVFVLLILTGIGHIVIAYNNRRKEYKLMSSVHIIRELGRDISIIVLGLLNFQVVGLLISQILSVFLGLNKQAKSLKSKCIDWSQISWNEMKQVALKHIRQPIYSVPASFINSFTYSVLNIFVGNIFGLTKLAYYSMSFRMLGLPLTLVSTNMSKVFFERASREYEQDGGFRKTFFITTIILGIVAVPMVIFLMLFAPALFGIFFGGEWIEAGEYVRYLAPMFGIRLVVSALTPTMTITQKQNFEFIIQFLFLFAIAIVYIIAQKLVNIHCFLVAVSISFSIVYVIDYFIMLKICKKNIYLEERKNG